MHGLPHWLFYIGACAAVWLFLKLLPSNTETGTAVEERGSIRIRNERVILQVSAAGLACLPACLRAHWGRCVKLRFWIQFACFLHFQLLSPWASAAFAEVQGLLWLALSGLHDCLRAERMIPVCGKKQPEEHIILVWYACGSKKMCQIEISHEEMDQMKRSPLLGSTYIAFQLSSAFTTKEVHTCSSVWHTKHLLTRFTFAPYSILFSEGCKWRMYCHWSAFCSLFLFQEENRDWSSLPQSYVTHSCCAVIQIVISTTAILKDSSGTWFLCHYCR